MVSTNQPRQYSLTRSDDGLHRRFAVKGLHGLDTPDGEVSDLLHTTAAVGDELVLSAPFGGVILTPARDRSFSSPRASVSPRSPG